MTISRRTLLVGAATGVAAASAWRFVRSSEADGIVAVVRERLDYLTLDDAGVYAFANDLIAQKTVAVTKLRLVAAAGPLYTTLGSTRPMKHLLGHGEERVVSLYLLSSDFFLNGSDETRRVQYVGFYDPLGQALACANPFARPVLS